MSGINVEEMPVLYSAGTKLAYMINKNYYKDVHYVWCTDCYHSSTQPATSDPQTICCRLLQIIKTGDRHATEIDKQISGILKGADAKLKAGIINKHKCKLIHQLVNATKYSDFTPVLYIISGARVKDKCDVVAREAKASDNSSEYLISELSADEFQILDFEQVFRDMIDISNRKVGE